MTKNKEPDTMPMFDVGEPVVAKKSADGKTGLTSAQLKAINWYAQAHSYRLRLSNPPTQMHFILKSTGDETTVHLDTILAEFKAWNDEDKKSRAAERKRGLEQAKRESRGYKS